MEQRHIDYSRMWESCDKSCKSSVAPLRRVCAMCSVCVMGLGLGLTAVSIWRDCTVQFVHELTLQLLNTQGELLFE